MSTVSLEILTDEELAVLSTEPTVVVTPHIDALTEAEREVATMTAYRSLLARGIIDSPTPEVLEAALNEAGDQVELRVRDDVLSTVTLRSSAPTVISVARTTQSFQDFWYAHLVADVVLLEEVSTEGLHRFAIARGLDLPQLLVTAACPADAADAEGKPIELNATDALEPPAAITDQLGQAWTRADVVIRSRHQPEPKQITGVFAGPGGSWTLTAQAQNQTVTFAPSTVADLHEQLRTLALEAIETSVLEEAR